VCLGSDRWQRTRSHLPAQRGGSWQGKSFEAKLLLAVKLYEVGKVSLGQAAKLAGFSKRAFMEVLGLHGVPIFDYSPGELRQEIDLCKSPFL
jgi:predicted HTH domain antitoxin